MIDKKDLRIVFLGTPEFAVTALHALLANKFNVVAVVTNIDKKSGRGMKLTSSAIKQFAIDHNIPVLQPKNLKSPEFIQELKSYNANVQVVVAFRMLPAVVWDLPPLGTINIHASLLPNYRGAAPINWAIINGETKSGVTTFQLKHEIDTGDILLQKSIEISKQDNVGSLHDKLANLGGEIITETLDQLCEGTLKAAPQKFSNADKKAPKLFKETCQIDWNNDGDTIYNFVRGLSPYPASFTHFDSKKVKVYKCQFINHKDEAKPGTIISDNKTYIKVACKDGWISLLEIQMEGKKRMLVEDFLRGNKV